VQEELQEMMIGRSDERVNPGRATAAEGRSIVVVSFAEPIWASGHRAASTGRTHDCRRTVHQILQKSSCASGAVHTCASGRSSLCAATPTQPKKAASKAAAVERDAFLRDADLADRPVRTLCMTLAYAGCRLSDALALTADRVDLAAGVLVFESPKSAAPGFFAACPCPLPC
jgi:hypothetical protein